MKDTLLFDDDEDDDTEQERARSRNDYNAGLANNVPNTKAGPPTDNLKPEDGTMKQYKTETQKKYPGYTNVAPPEKVKINDRLKIGGAEGDGATMQSRNDYGATVGDGGRPTPYKPTSQISNGGHIDYGTVNQDHYQYNDTTPTKVTPPADNLHPIDGTMAQYKTEVQKRYKAYDHASPAEPVKMPDHIGFDTNDDPDLESEHKKQYDGRPAERVAIARPSTTLAREGDMNWQTNKNSDYMSHDVSKQGKVNIEDNLNPFQGKFKDKSESRKQYDGKQTERTSMARPGTTMLREGDFDWDANKKSDYKAHELNRQEQTKVKDNLKPFEGKLKDKSESKKQYDGKQAERTSMARPGTTMLREGDFDWDANTKSDYKAHELRRQDMSKAQDNLKPFEGKLHAKSESKKQFDGKQTERANKARPNTSMLREGDFDWEANKKSDYKKHELTKQEQIKAQDNLKLFEGKLRDKSESKKQYDGKQAERTNMVRPGTTMLREGDFDWETNKRADYKQHELRRQEISKAQDNLKPFEGKLKGKSESKKQFDGKQADRTTMARPGTTMLREGDFDWNTHKGDAYKNYDGVKKIEKQKMDDNLKSRGLSFEEGTSGRRDFKDHGIKGLPERGTKKDNLEILGKGEKLEGMSVAKMTYQGQASNLGLQGRQPIQRGSQKGNLALVDAPLEGQSESKSNYISNADHDRSKAFERPRPQGNLEVNKGLPFTQKQSTDYHAGFATSKPEKVSCVL